MNTAELKKLADKCICHPISRSISDVEHAGEAIKELLAINAELVEALKEISTDYADRFDLESPSTNPGIKSSISQARAALAKAEGGEL